MSLGGFFTRDFSFCFGIGDGLRPVARQPSRTFVPRRLFDVMDLVKLLVESESELHSAAWRPFVRGLLGWNDQ
jgi:hypothetical protein